MDGVRLTGKPGAGPIGDSNACHWLTLKMAEQTPSIGDPEVAFPRRKIGDPMACSPKAEIVAGSHLSSAVARRHAYKSAYNRTRY